MLGQGRYDIKTVSLSKDYVQSIGGFRVLPDYDMESVPKEYEALVLIGGMTWRNENTQQIKTLVGECYKKVLTLYSNLKGNVLNSSLQ